MTSRGAIGIDGGGTKTEAVLISSEGVILAQARGGPSNYQDVGIDAAVEVWTALVEQLLRGREALRVDASVWGLSGWDRPQDEQVLRLAVDQLDPAPKTWRTLCNDAFLLLRSGSARGVGVAVISGTGSNCVGIGAGGGRGRIGGNAYEFGDGGSGHDIGVDGLRAAFRGDDGRGPKTLLSQLLCQRLQLRRLPDIIDRFVADATEAMSASRIAPLVFEASASGDHVAGEILRRAGEELGLSARLLASQFFAPEDTFDLVLGGSVLRCGICPRMRQSLVHTVKGDFPAARVSVPTQTPILGAALEALDLLRARDPSNCPPNSATLLEEVAGQLEPQ